MGERRHAANTKGDLLTGRAAAELLANIGGETEEIDVATLEDERAGLDLIQLREIAHQPVNSSELAQHDRAELFLLLPGEMCVEALRRGLQTSERRANFVGEVIEKILL